MELECERVSGIDVADSILILPGLCKLPKSCNVNRALNNKFASTTWVWCKY